MINTRVSVLTLFAAVHRLWDDLYLKSCLFSLVNEQHIGARSIPVYLLHRVARFFSSHAKHWRKVAQSRPISLLICGPKWSTVIQKVARCQLPKPNFWELMAAKSSPTFRPNWQPCCTITLHNCKSAALNSSFALNPYYIILVFFFAKAERLELIYQYPALIDLYHTLDIFAVDYLKCYYKQ